MIYCLFGVFRSTLELFTHINILTYTRHPCPVITEGSTAFHTYRDTSDGHFQGILTLTALSQAPGKVHVTNCFDNLNICIVVKCVSK